MGLVHELASDTATVRAVFRHRFPSKNIRAIVLLPNAAWGVMVDEFDPYLRGFAKPLNGNGVSVSRQLEAGRLGHRAAPVYGGRRAQAHQRRRSGAGKVETWVPGKRRDLAAQAK